MVITTIDACLKHSLEQLLDSLHVADKKDRVLLIVPIVLGAAFLLELELLHFTSRFMLPTECNIPSTCQRGIRGRLAR